MLFAGWIMAQNPDLVYQKFVKGYDDLDATAIGNLYTKDAALLNLYQNSEPKSFKGKTAIVKSFQEFFTYTEKENRTLKNQL